MTGERKVKQSIYLPDGAYDEIVHEAKRLDRSAAWILQRAWELAKAKMRELPAPPEEPREK